jgi:hypothetical protein
MVRNLLVVVTLLLSLSSSSYSKGTIVILYNNASVDLTVRSTDEKVLASIPPGKTAEVYFQKSQWIDFGMIGHRYETKDFRITGFVHDDKVKVQVENDGRLYPVPHNTTFPLKTFPKQPAGFPLVPIQKADLT